VHDSVAGSLIAKPDLYRQGRLDDPISLKRRMPSIVLPEHRVLALDEGFDIVIDFK
jgi:hypothetical protein